MAKDWTMRAWILRNEQSLRADYRAYAIQHDYDLEGVIDFEHYARKQWHIHMEYLMQEQDKNENTF